MWDPRQKDIPVANMEASSEGGKRDCWCVAFGKWKVFSFVIFSLTWMSNENVSTENCSVFPNRAYACNQFIFFILFRSLRMKVFEDKKGRQDSGSKTVFLQREKKEKNIFFCNEVIQ